MVETPHDLTRELNVCRLIDPHRHPLGLIHDDIGRLEQGIAQKAIRIQITIAHLLLLLSKAWDTLQPGYGCDHR